MNTTAIRARSIAEAARLGYTVSADLPLSEGDVSLRSQEEVVRRCLALFTLVSVAYGFLRPRATKWLQENDLEDALSPRERDYLRGPGTVMDTDGFKASVEALWAFMWALEMIPTIDFGLPCDDNLIAMFPNLKENEPTEPFFERARLRSAEQVVEMDDLAYCIHWAIVQARFEGLSIPGAEPPYSVIERRRALEWIISDEDWDDVSLDT